MVSQYKSTAKLSDSLAREREREVVRADDSNSSLAVNSLPGRGVRSLLAQVSQWLSKGAYQRLWVRKWLQ